VKGIIFLYYILCQTVGAAGLLGSIVYAASRKSARDARFALFSGTFACIIVSFSGFTYQDSAGGLGVSMTVLSFTLYGLSVLGNCGLVWTLPAFIDSVSPRAPRRSGAVWAGLASLAGAVTIVNLVIALVAKRATPAFFVSAAVPFVLMFAAIAYANVRGVIACAAARKIPSERDEGWGPLLRLFMIASVALFPFIVMIDLFPEILLWRLFPRFPRFLRVFPALYAFFNAVYLARIFRLMLGEEKAGGAEEGGAAVPAKADWLARTGLSAREAEVARLLASGIAYKEIAWRLRIRMGTVQSHVMAAYRKLGVSCKEDLMRVARGELAPEAGGGKDGGEEEAVDRA